MRWGDVRWGDVRRGDVRLSKKQNTAIEGNQNIDGQKYQYYLSHVMTGNGRYFEFQEFT